jgi:GTP pyrophosphokinase
MQPIKSAVSIENVLAQLPEERYTETDRELIQRAYRVAEEAHREQKRHSGEPYIIHCIAVAEILASLKQSPEVIAAGLLHDTVEDTSLTNEDIKREFGESIASLVEGVTKLTHMPRVSRGDQHAEANSASNDNEAEELDAPALLGRKEDMIAETLRKTFIAMGKDVRVMFIKLADRLHNMRTLNFAPEHKRKRVAQQTLEIFAPVASRLGIAQIKWELEDLSFLYLDPEKFKEISEQIAEKRPEREAQIEEIKEKLVKLLADQNIKSEISGRPKHIYSIYRKMQKKNKSFEKLYDIRAVRLVVDDIPSCYSALGFINTTWQPLHGEIDDYISFPKHNFYQSLHTAVIYEDNRPLEIQIRTPEMHVNAEYGAAAHWQYKEGRVSDKHSDKHYEMFISTLRTMADLEAEARDAAEFVESVRNDVFQDRIYVFTPRGDIIDLPAGSTSIDFAYHVHTTVGHRCRGARINSKLASLEQELKTGDHVEILTTKQLDAGPSRDWLNSSLNLVRTQRARGKIKTWFKKQEDSLNLAQGRASLEGELRKLGLFESVNYEKLARGLSFKTPDDLFLAIGKSDLTTYKVIKYIGEEEEKAKQQETESFQVGQATVSATSTDLIEVVGLKGMLTTMAKCCNPMPGEPIAGFVTRGRGVTIHRSDCPNILQNKENERLLKVVWGKQERTSPVPIIIRAYDRPGLVTDISKKISDENINITKVNVHVNNNMANIHLTIEVKSITQLSKVLTLIEKIDNVVKAQRAKPG